MKKTLFAILTVLLVGQAANATSPVKNIRAEFRNSPVQGVVGGKTTAIRIYNDGVVIRSESNASLPGPQPTPVIITKLTAYDMDRIERMVEDSRGGAVQLLPPQAHCFVAPSDTNSYTADNGRVFLKSGHFCTGFRQNVRNAASELVNILDTLKTLTLANSFSVQD